MSVQSIIRSSSDDLQKYVQIQEHTSTKSVEDIENAIQTLDESDLSWKVALYIGIIELKILQGDSTCASELAEATSYLAQLRNVNTNSELRKLLKFRINDLNTDYQYTFNVINYNYKIMELVNKKVNLLTSMEYNFPVEHKVPLIYKIVDYLIVSDYDFRKIELIKFIHHFANENGLVIDTSPLTSRLLNMLLTRSFVDVHTYKEYLDQARTRLITRLYFPKLLSNLVENNLHVASTCYESVSLQKLNRMLGLEIDHLLISKMIVKDNLPAGTKFDQVNLVLTFPKSEHDGYNSCLKLIQNISNKLAA